MTVSQYVRRTYMPTVIEQLAIGILLMGEVVAWKKTEKLLKLSYCSLKLQSLSL